MALLTERAACSYPAVLARLSALAARRVKISSKMHDCTVPVRIKCVTRDASVFVSPSARARDDQQRAGSLRPVNIGDG
jgi:hypothetical protein